MDRTSGASCWQWLGGTARGGYGKLHFEGEYIYAHRLAWELTNGKIPPSLQVCHRCDNPGCCNPGHLFLGTQSDNIRDMLSKKRNVICSGELHGNSKLIDSEVKTIRSLIGIKSHRSLAMEFGVEPSTIYLISKRKIWKHI